MNEYVRDVVRANGVTYRQIAKHIGIRADTLSDEMAVPLSEWNRNRILKAVEEIVGECCGKEGGR